ncbi:MAG TPA: menaquinone biosynthesis protein [Candidatus Krumholzibacteria bacterium]|nr:menaquinone biosynthesis protein [Candidatus Krumholzibacteria bacterium]
MTSPLRIGQIPFLNCLLFFNGLENEPGVRLLPLVPRALSAAAMGDAVDAGPVPLVDTWEMTHCAPLGDFCIATTQRARSVFLFSKRPWHALDGAEIGITDQTSTSVRLLKVLLANVWEAKPERFTSIDRTHNDAFLVIGDDALRARAGIPEFPHMADLGGVWTEWTGLPFVFARWVARRDLRGADRDRLCALLERSMAANWKSLDRIAVPRAAELGMTVAEVREYLEGFRFVATDAEHKAMAKFKELDATTRANEAAAVAREESA